MRNPEKSALRKQFRRARAQMSADERNAATETINACSSPYIKKGRKIGVYWPMGKELRLDGFVRAAQKRGAKTLPALYRTAHAADVVHPLTLPTAPNKNANAAAPNCTSPNSPDKKIRVHQLNLLLVPIVGIDKRGYRLGQAGGYYDATLSAMKYRLQTQTLGVGFGCQLTDTLPTEPTTFP